MINSKKQKEIAIIGAGEIGTALEFILREKGITPILWDRDKKKLNRPTGFSEVINSAQVIFLGIPSWANRSVAKNIYEELNKENDGNSRVVITFSKGLEKDSLKTMNVVLEEEARDKFDYGILVGPMIAEEIKLGQPTVGVAGLSCGKWETKLEELFRDSNLKIYFSDDLSGLAICSVLKNIYSLALGIADGAGFGANVKSYLTIKAFQEMKAITVMLGGDRKTCEGLAGLGDLLATGWNNYSYNFTTGRRIALREEKDSHSEGYVSFLPLMEILGKRFENFDILVLLKKIILEKKDAQETLKKGLFKKDQ